MTDRLLVALMANLLLAAGARAEENKDLAALAKSAGGWKSYGFVVDQKPGTGKPVEGKYQDGQPTWFKAEGIEFYRKDKVLIYQDAGRWQRTKTGVESDPLRILGASARVRSVLALPHEELAGLAADLTDVKKTAGKEKDTTIYTGTLTPAALKKWAPTEVRDVTREGSVEVVATGDKVTRYTVTLRLKGRLGNAEID